MEQTILQYIRRILTVLVVILVLPIGLMAQTTAPTLTSPTSASLQRLVNIQYILPQTPLPGSILLSFNDGSTTYQLGMSSSTSVSFTLNPTTDILLNSAVQSITPDFVRGGVHNSLPDGTFTVTLSYQNSLADPPASAVSTNVIIDATPPVLSLLGVDPIDVTQGTAYSDAGATATDVREGNLSGSIITTDSVDTSTVGSYTVRYNVTDSAGNSATELTRTVNVVAAPTPTPTPGVGPVIGTVTPATKNILIYVYEYDLDSSETGYAEGSCLTLVDGSFSCPVAAPGYFMVRPIHNEYSFTASEEILPNGFASAPFTASFHSISRTGCKRRDNARKIQVANASAKSIYDLVTRAIAQATTIAEGLSIGSSRTKLLVAISNAQAKALPSFSAIISDMEEFAPIVLSCKQVAGCTKFSLKHHIKAYRREVQKLTKLISAIESRLSSITKGKSVAKSLAIKREKALAKALRTVEALPLQSYGCI